MTLDCFRNIRLTEASIFVRSQLKVSRGNDLVHPRYAVDAHNRRGDALSQPGKGDMAHGDIVLLGKGLGTGNCLPVCSRDPVVETRAGCRPGGVTGRTQRTSQVSLGQRSPLGQWRCQFRFSSN